MNQAIGIQMEHQLGGKIMEEKKRKSGSGGSRPNAGRKALEPTENYTIKISVQAKVFYQSNEKGLARKVLEDHYRSVQADA